MRHSFISQTQKTGITESLFGLLMFAIPFYSKIISPLLIIVLISAIIEKKLIFSRSKLLFNSPLLVLSLLYLLYVLWMFTTSDFSAGFMILERKLSLLILPLFFIWYMPKDSSAFFKFICKWFIYGIIISASVCLIIAATSFLYELYCREYRIILIEYPYTNYFFSSYLSQFMHYGYLSMFVNMAIVLQIWLFLTNFSSSNKKTIFRQSFCVFFLSVFVLMLYAKAGTIMLVCIYIFTLVYFLIKLKSKIISLSLVVLFLILGFIFVKYIPNATKRFLDVKNAVYSKQIDNSTGESTQVRLLVWDCSWKIIKKNFYLGYGTGDAQLELNKMYKSKKMTIAFEKELNAHNEFLQSWIEIGILGPICLLVFIFWFMIHSYKHDYIYIGWLYILIILISFLTESTLRTQTGVLFTCLFAGLISISGISKKLS